MNIRNKIMGYCEPILRVPPLLMVDEMFRISFGFGGRLIEKIGANNIISQNNDFSHNGGDPLGNHFLNSSGENIFSQSSSFATVNPFLSYYSTSNSQSALNASNYYLGPAYPMSSSIPSVAQSQSQTIVGGNGGDFVLMSAFKGLCDALFTGPLSSTLMSAGTEDSVGGSNQSEYLYELNFGDLSALQGNVTFELLRIGEVLGCLIVFFAALIMFLLSTENLLKLYSYLLSVLTVYLAYVMTPIPFLWTTEAFFSLFCNIAFRTGLVCLFFLTRSWPSDQSHDNPNLTSVLDALIFSLFYLTGVVRLQPFVYLLLVLVLQNSMWTRAPKVVFTFLKKSWKETRRVQNEYGLSHLIQVECGRLRVNTVFRLFWISLIINAFFRCCDESLAQIFRFVLSRGTETFTGIVGLTVTVSVICHSIGEFLLWILYLGTNSETDANRFGSISTVLFFILSLQTGLTSLDPEKRLDRLFKNIVLLATALFHALHQMVAPLLHAFRTFQGLQIRAVTISMAFLSISVFSTVYLLRFSSVSTWSLAVLALAIEFKIKIVISLIISVVVYLSQLVQYPEILQKSGNVFRAVLPLTVTRVFDKLADQLSHEDMVFYLKSIANVAEFLTGIFLFINAVWIFMFESASAIRAIGMTIHAYFNIWCEAWKGWKIYCQRKTASMKIMSLSDATDEQLAAREDDVCAICYEEMETAKVTLCQHLFHAVCLRKWLYVQNTCPLCHELLYGEGIGEVQQPVVEVEEEQMLAENATVLPVAPQSQSPILDPQLAQMGYVNSQQSSETSHHRRVSFVDEANESLGGPHTSAAGIESRGRRELERNEIGNNNGNINNVNTRPRGGLAVLL